MKPHLLTLLLLATILTAACNRSIEMDPGFIEGDGITLVLDGKTILRYDPLTWQLGYNAAKGEFQAFSDDMSSYYILTCKAIPSSEGESITANMEWKTGEGLKKKSGVKFSVKRIGDDGRIWLWNASDGIGIVVRILAP